MKKILISILALFLTFEIGFAQSDSIEVAKTEAKGIMKELFMFKMAIDVLEIRQLISNNELGDSVENYMYHYDNALFFKSTLLDYDFFWNRVLGRKKYKVPERKIFLDSKGKYLENNDVGTSIDFDIVLTPNWEDSVKEESLIDYNVKITTGNYTNLAFIEYEERTLLDEAMNSHLTKVATPKEAKVNDAVFNGLEKLRVLCADLKKPNFHITVGTDTTKFENDSEICINQRNGKIKLTLHYDNPLYPMDDIKWELDGDKVGGGLTYDISLLDAKNKKVSILRGGFSFFEFEFSIYENPIIVFDKSKTFNGSYGFDNADYDALRNSGDYDKLNLFGHNNYDYYVPLLTSSNTVNLSIDVKSLKSKAKNDANFKVKFIPSISDIKINNLDSLILDYTQLKNLNSIQIEKRNPNATINFSNLDYVGVFTQDNQLIGKLKVIRKQIVDKDIVFVIVNNGTGVPSLNHNTVFNFFNNNSHNQFFIRYNLNSIEYITTNISGVSATDAILALNTAIIAQTGRSPSFETGKYFFFITDIAIPKSNDPNETDYTGGVAITGKNIAAIFLKGKEGEAAHELGHCLGLPHTFCGFKSKEQGSQFCIDCVLHSGIDRSIPEKKSNNIMDYSTIKEVFYLYQWKYIFINHP